MDDVQIQKLEDWIAKLKAQWPEHVEVIAGAAEDGMKRGEAPRDVANHILKTLNEAGVKA